MTVRAKRYWAAVKKDVYETNLRTRSGKVYYSFTGEELLVADGVGDVVRAVFEAGTDEQWMVFKYVPVPSSMHAACWAALHGETEDVSFEVRVHEKFAFPRSERGGELADSGTRPSELLDGVESSGDSPLENAGASLAQALNVSSRVRAVAVEQLRAIAAAVGDEDDASDYYNLAQLLESEQDGPASDLAESMDPRLQQAIPDTARPFCGLRSAS